MSQYVAPHYSHIVHDINSRGGITIYFANRGHQGDAGERHFDTVMPRSGVLLHEFHTVDADDAHPLSPAHNGLRSAAADYETVVLPAGYYGSVSSTADELPSFHPSELLALMPKSKHHVTEPALERYQALQRIRELRAGVGSLAWLAALSEQRGFKGKPVVLWGRTHSASLPSVYDRVGIQSVEAVDLDAPHRYSYLQPHGMSWGEDDIQNVFAATYRHAKTVI